MKSSNIMSALGALMAIACAGTGIVDGFIMAGVGICGFPLSWGIFSFAALTALLPAGTVGILSGRWWLAPVIYSVSLAFPLLTGLLMWEWHRSVAALACIVIAFTGAWLFRPRSGQAARP